MSAALAASILQLINQDDVDIARRLAARSGFGIQVRGRRAGAMSFSFSAMG
jgi:hypothetical protein